MKTTPALLFIALAFTCGCAAPGAATVSSGGTPVEAVDAGVAKPAPSAASEDASASVPAMDPASVDGATASDAGAADPSDAVLDAQRDAELPANASAPAVDCADVLSDVYVTPSGLPAMSDAHRGDVVRCASDVSYSVADVTLHLASAGVALTPTSGTSIYRVAFRTERGNGGPGISSARVYLPSAPKSLPLPVVVIAHPTVGIAPSCAPSMDAMSMQDLALPWAALGYAVIAPDYAGLGTSGVQGYLDNRDTAYSTLDGARALRNVLSSGTLDDRVLVVGYSQGGGAALSAQALASTYGAGGRLVGVVAIAPEWPSRLNSFEAISMLRAPTSLTITTGISNPVVMAMRQYAYFANDLGSNDPTSGFPASARAALGNAVDTLCQTPLGGYIQGADPHVGDLIDDTLRTAVLACVDGNGSGAGCQEPGASYYRYLNANILTADPNGAPILFVQGLLDEIMPAASEAACNLDKLAADGVHPQVCIDLTADHLSVSRQNIVFATQWGEAILAGTPAPTCSNVGLPACTP